MTETDRKTRTDNKFFLPEEVFQPTLGETIIYLGDLRDQGWERVKYDNANEEVVLSRDRPETDEEYAHRLWLESETKASLDEGEKLRKRARFEVYLRLREEFGEFREYWEEGK